MDYYICINCVKHKLLKKLIKENSELAVCSICKENQQTINISKYYDFKLLIKCLIRYYYSESDYNPNIGAKGDVNTIFENENEILNFKIPSNIDCEANPLYKNILINSDDYRKGVSLFHRELYGTRGWILTPLKDEKDDIDERTSTLNPNLIANQIVNRLKKFIDKLGCKTVESTQLFYRARIGVDKEVYEYTSDNILECWKFGTRKILPYSNNLISAPEPRISKEGRLNRKGYSFLYLATDKNTAISEVKPNIGHYVSVGKFKVAPELKIADFRDVNIYKFYKSDDDIEDFIFFKTLAESLSLPNPNKTYFFTQTIADALIILGFDGVTFKSSLTDGYNLVLFNSEDAEYVQSSSEIVKIQKTKYIYEDLDINIKPDYYYEMNDKENRILGKYGLMSISWTQKIELY